jgi:hypothetical protein
MAVVGMLLVEVWQSSRMAELCLSLDKTRSALVQAQARLEFTRARIDRETTRTELAPVATALGLVPADAQQVVHLPSASALVELRQRLLCQVQRGHRGCRGRQYALGGVVPR